MDHGSGETSFFLSNRKATLSSKALSTLRVMAFLDDRRVQSGLMEPLRRLFASKNEELEFDFPNTAIAHREACAELIKDSLLKFSRKGRTYAMTPELQTSVLADLQTARLLAPLFNGTVKVLSGLWPKMICIPDRTVGQQEFKAATAPGTNYEAYLKKRHFESQLSRFEEYGKYANRNVWGRRDELVHHVARLEQIFFHLDDATIEVCATVTFAMLLGEASWYYFERSRYYDAEIKIESALGVYELGRARSSLHHASIYRVRAAIALESGKFDEAAKYVNNQVELLGLHHTPQGDVLKESGLLDRRPDAISPPSQVHDVHPGVFVVLPFRSICSFGHKLYFSASDVKDERYPIYLHHAETCFTTALKDCEIAHIKMAKMGGRIGQLHYALGNVANKQVCFLGKAHVYQCLQRYENALQYFQHANANDTHSNARIAKAHYKLATQFIQLEDYKSAIHHIDEATLFYGSDTAYEPHLARLFFQRSKIETLTGSSGAKSFLHSAFALRGGIKPEDKRSAEELSEADFDELVGIWEK